MANIERMRPHAIEEILGAYNKEGHIRVPRRDRTSRHGVRAAVRVGHHGSSIISEPKITDTDRHRCRVNIVVPVHVQCTFNFEVHILYIQSVY